MKLVIHPPVEPERLDRIMAGAGPMAAVNAADEEHAHVRLVRQTRPR
jgi:hypothetical protein